MKLKPSSKLISTKGKKIPSKTSLKVENVAKELFRVSRLNTVYFNAS